jgi:hypothetical protein
MEAQWNHYERLELAQQTTRLLTEPVGEAMGWAFDLERR